MKPGAVRVAESSGGAETLSRRAPNKLVTSSDGRTGDSEESVEKKKKKRNGFEMRGRQNSDGFRLVAAHRKGRESKEPN